MNIENPFFSLNIITLFFILHFLIMFILQLIARKSLTINSVASKIFLFAAMVILVLLIYLRITVWIIPACSNSILYAATLFFILLVWVYFYLVNTFLRTEKAFLYANKPEVITILLASNLHRKTFIYHVLKVNPETYLFAYAIITTILLSLELYYFNQAYTWLIISGIYITLVHLRQNTIVLLRHFEDTHQPTPNDGFIVNSALKEIYYTGSWWEGFTYTPSPDNSDIPRGWGWGFPKGTSNNVMFGSCAFVGVFALGAYGYTYNTYLNTKSKYEEITRQAEQQTRQVEMESKTRLAEAQLKTRQVEMESKTRLAKAELKTQRIDQQVRLAETELKTRQMEYQTRQLEAQTRLAEAELKTRQLEMQEKMNKKN